MTLINNTFEQQVEKVKTDKNGNYYLIDSTVQRKEEN